MELLFDSYAVIVTQETLTRRGGCAGCEWQHEDSKGLLFHCSSHRLVRARRQAKIVVFSCKDPINPKQGIPDSASELHVN